MQQECLVAPPPVDLGHEPAGQALSALVTPGADTSDAASAAVVDVDAQVACRTVGVLQPEVRRRGQKVAAVDVLVLDLLLDGEHRVADTPDVVDVLGRELVALLASDGHRLHSPQVPKISSVWATSVNPCSPATRSAQRSTVGPSTSTVRPQLRQTR